jgi:crooked neck
LFDHNNNNNNSSKVINNNNIMADETDSIPVGEGRAPRVPKVAKVKNKAPAPLQITAEQLLREAKERQLEIVPAPPKQKIQDADELAEYQVN